MVDWDSIWSGVKYITTLIGMGAAGYGAGRLYQWIKHSRPAYKEYKEKISELEVKLTDYEEQEKEDTFTGILMDVLTTKEEIDTLEKEIAVRTQPKKFDLKFKLFQRYATDDEIHDTQLLGSKKITCTLEGDNVLLVPDLYRELKKGEKSCRIDATGKYGDFDTMHARTYKRFEDARIARLIEEYAPGIFDLVNPKFEALQQLIDTGLFTGKQKQLTMEDFTEKQKEAYDKTYYNDLNGRDTAIMKRVIYDPYDTPSQAARALGLKKEEERAKVEAFWEHVGEKEPEEKPALEAPKPPTEDKMTRAARKRAPPKKRKKR